MCYILDPFLPILHSSFTLEVANLTCLVMDCTNFSPSIKNLKWPYSKQILVAAKWRFRYNLLTVLSSNQVI